MGISDEYIKSKSNSNRSSISSDYLKSKGITKSSGMSTTFKEEPKEDGPGFFGKIFNVLDVGAKASGSAIRYGMEAITGKDFYQEGDFKKVLGNQQTESFVQSFNRVYQPTSILGKTASTVGGFALDIVSDPLTYLGGVGLLKKAKDSTKLMKSLNNVRKLEDSIVDAKKFGKAGDELKDLEKQLDTAKKLSDEVAEVSFNKMQSSTLMKAQKYITKAELGMAGALALEGVNQAVNGETNADKFLGGVMGVMGAMGFKYNYSNGKFLGALNESKTLDDFKQNAVKYFTGENHINGAEYAVSEMQKSLVKLGNFKTEINGIIDNYGVKKERVESIFNAVEGRNIDLSEGEQKLVKTIKDIDDYAKEVRIKEGEDVFDMNTYLPVIIVRKDGSMPTMEELTQINNPKTLKEANLSFDKTIGARLYKDADARDVVLDKFGLKTNRDIFKVLDKQLGYLESFIGPRGMRDGLHNASDKLNTGVKMKSNPKNLSQLKKNLKSDYKKELTKLKFDKNSMKKDIRTSSYKDIEVQVDEFDSKIKQIELMNKAPDEEALLIENAYVESLNNIVAKADNDLSTIIKDVDMMENIADPMALLKEKVQALADEFIESGELSKEVLRKLAPKSNSKKDIKKSIDEYRKVAYELRNKRLKGVDEWVKERKTNIRGEVMKPYYDELKEIETKRAKIIDEGRVKGEKWVDVSMSNMLAKVPGTSGMMIRSDIEDSLMNILEKRKNNDAIANIQDGWNTVKALSTVGDFFQFWQATRQSYALGSAIKNPLYGLKLAKNTAKTFWSQVFIPTLKNRLPGDRVPKEFMKRTEEVIGDGLQLGGSIELNTVKGSQDLLDKLADKEFSTTKNAINRAGKYIEEDAKNLPQAVVQKIVKPFKNYVDDLEDRTWNIFMPSIKMNMYDELKTHLSKQGVENAGKKSAEYINNAFQGQNWELMMARNPGLSKRVMGYMRLAMFAPDYVVSNLKLTDSALKMDEIGTLAKKQLAYSWATGAMVTELINYRINGHTTAENLPKNSFRVQIPGIKDEQGNPLGVSIMGNWNESFRIASNPAEFLAGKKGAVLGAILKADRFGTEQALKDLMPIPMFAKPIVGMAIDKDSEEVGVAEDIGDASLQSLIEFLGAQAYYSSEKSERKLSGFQAGIGGATQTVADSVKGEEELPSFLR